MKVKQRETIRDELCELRRLESLWEEADAVANARAKEVLVLLGELRDHLKPHLTNGVADDAAWEAIKRASYLIDEEAKP